jgi:hypothetical protein
MHWNAILGSTFESHPDVNPLRSSRSKIRVEAWGAHESTFRLSSWYQLSMRLTPAIKLSRFSKSCNSLADECNAHAQQDQCNGEIELPNVYGSDEANAQPTGRHRQWKEDQGCL